MEKQVSIEIPEHLDGQRLDQVAAKLFPDYSRGKWQTWIRNGQVSLDGSPITRMRTPALTGQQLTASLEIEIQDQWKAQDIPLDIVHEDDDILVINKPAGLVVHPGAGNPDGTLLNALLHHQPNLAELPRAGIIHRIDKDTTGLMLITKSLKAHHWCVKALERHEIQREYEAIVNGTLIAGSTIEAPIGRHPTKRTLMAVRPDGKPAITHYRIDEKYPFHTSLNLKLETGRTHQIRVHMAHTRHPIVGDPAYERQRRISQKLPEATRETLVAFKRQALHAKRLTFQHPTEEVLVQFEKDLPEDHRKLKAALRIPEKD